MSFQQALSGLNASSTQLSTIGNNVANSGTVGFKMALTQFADSYASSMQGGGTSPVGIGTQIAAIAQQFTQGNLTTTNNPLDISINGGGMFRLDNQGVVTYTRNGQFLLDKDGFITNSSALKLTGYAADPTTGAIVPGYITPLQINNNAIPPVATTISQIQVNLDSRTSPPLSMTHGSTTGSAAPINVNNVTAANNDFMIAVDGMPAVTVTIPVPAVPYTLSTLVPVMEDAINTALNTPNSTGAAVDVSLSNTLPQTLIVTSRSVGSVGSQGFAPPGSAVVLSAGATNGYSDFFQGGTAVAPTAVVGQDNFNPAKTDSYTSSTAQTVYDTLGNPHTLSMYFVKTSKPALWQLYTSLDGGTPTAATNLSFSGSGVLTSPASGVPLPQSFLVTTGADPLLNFDLDLTGTTQYGIPFGTNQLIQDGYTSGKLSGMSVSNEGVIQGRYSNGKTRNMGQLVLANFNNPNGLQSLGNNQWAETSASGSPIPGAPGTGNLGLVQSGAVEESNVDLTAELVNMITAQRAYQANAQTIKTMDQLMQTLVNLR